MATISLPSGRTNILRSEPPKRLYLASGGSQIVSDRLLAMLVSSALQFQRVCAREREREAEKGIQLTKLNLSP